MLSSCGAAASGPQPITPPEKSKGKPRHKLRTVAKVLSQRAADTNTDVLMGAAGQGQARCAGRVKPDER